MASPLAYLGYFLRSNCQAGKLFSPYPIIISAGKCILFRRTSSENIYIYIQFFVRDTKRYKIVYRHAKQLINKELIKNKQLNKC